MKRIETYELIERYLRNSLTSTEIEEFESRLKNDFLFASEVESHKKLQRLMIDHSLNDIKDKLSFIRQKKAGLVKLRKRIIRNIIIVTSVSIMILSIYSLFSLNKEDSSINSASGTDKAPEVLIDSHLIDSTKKLYSPENKIELNMESSAIVSEPKNRNIHMNADLNPSGTKLTTDLSIPTEKATFELIQSNMDNNDKLENNKAEYNLPCELIAEIVVEPSCNNQATGSISIPEQFVKGGTPPYKCQLNGYYNDSMTFKGLLPGLYIVSITDINNCKKGWDAVKVGKKECFSDFKFAPYFGEVWDVPLESGLSGELKIYNRNGFMVYQMKFDGLSSLSWNGINFDEEELPGGAYPFEIYYSSGSVFRGTVTIVK